MKLVLLTLLLKPSPADPPATAWTRVQIAIPPTDVFKVGVVNETPGPNSPMCGVETIRGQNYEVFGTFADVVNAINNALA